MWAPIEKVWNFFAPPEFAKVLEFMELRDMDQMRKANSFFRVLDSWGTKISVSFFIVGLFIAAAVASPWGFAFASEVDKKVAAAKAEMKEDMDEVKTRLTTIERQTLTMNTALSELLAQKVATDICRGLKRWKSEVDILERRNLRTEVDNLQKRHKALEGSEYPEDRCQ